METHLLAEICFHTFNSSAGKMFLEYLMDEHFNRRVYQPGITFDAVAYLEGKRHVVDDILALQKMYLTGEYPAEAYTEGDGNGGVSG